MREKSLGVSLSHTDPQSLLVRVRDSLAFASATPTYLSVDDKSKPTSPDWIERWAHRCRRNLFAAWDQSYDRFLSYTKDLIVKVSDFSGANDPSVTLSWCETLPFNLASFGPLHSEWSERDDFPGPGFGDGHFPLGWACAFRGEGHNRLVSRRWLEFGPWRLMRGGNDTSFIQFHDLDTDPDTAFIEARPGHERMGISDKGGFIQSGYVYSYPIDGLYTPEERRLRILVHGREVSQLEMLDACAARLYQALGPERPLDAIAYVFADESVATAHLHQLWLRELECWTFTKGREVRLDLDYRPSPVKPVWVQEIQ